MTKEKNLKKSDYELAKIFLPYFKPYKNKLFLAILLVPIASFTYAAQPYILQKTIDDALQNFDLEKLYFYCLILFFVIVVNFIVQTLQFWLINEIAQLTLYDLRHDMFEFLLKLPLRYFDKTPVGRSVSRITSDVEQFSESFASGLVYAVLDIFNIVAILAFMFYLNWQLSLAVSFFLIPIIYISHRYKEFFRVANMDLRKKLSEINSFLQQNIVGINVVYALNSVEKSKKIFAKANKDFFEANDATIKADSQLSAIVELISILALLVMIFISSKVLENQVLTIGTILAFLQYTQTLFEPIRTVSDRFTIVQAAFTAAQRVDQLMIEDLESDKGSIEKIELSNKIFEAKSISFRYSRPLDTVDEASNQEILTDWVLKDLNFVFLKNKKYAIVGRTGSGKSTIIKLLTRLYDADHGELFFYDRDIRDYQKKFLRSKIAVIHQDSYIFAGSLKENIALNRDPKSLDFDFIKPLLEILDFDLDMVLSERASNISSGQAQVINFARALVSKPDIVVLDEATAKIDIKTEKVLYNFLENYLKGRTAIVIAHRLDTIKFCDEIVFLKNGKVIEKGSHEELLNLKKEYYNFYLNKNLQKF